MNEETPTMTCDWCGKEFPADPRACVEGGFSAFDGDNEGEEWKGAQTATIDPDMVSAEQKEEMKREMGLSDGELDQLLRTGSVEGLGAIVCVDCQDAGTEIPDINIEP